MARRSPTLAGVVFLALILVQSAIQSPVLVAAQLSSSIPSSSESNPTEVQEAPCTCVRPPNSELPLQSDVDLEADSSLPTETQAW